jgi:hypothetical protein
MLRLAEANAQAMPADASSPIQVAQATGKIVDVASGSDDFDTLVRAVQTADLVDALYGLGTFTVFAPTDDLETGGVETLNGGLAVRSVACKLPKRNRFQPCGKGGFQLVGQWARSGTS